MGIPKYTMASQGEFVAKPSRMGKKIIIIVPTEFHGDFDKVINKHLKFKWQEILGK